MPIKPTRSGVEGQCGTDLEEASAAHGKPARSVCVTAAGHGGHVPLAAQHGGAVGATPVAVFALDLDGRVADGELGLEEMIEGGDDV